MITILAICHLLLMVGYLHFVFFLGRDAIQYHISGDAMNWFTAPLMLVYLTCGLHHFHHGTHLLIEGVGQRGTPALIYPEIFVVGLQTLFCLTWVALRYEREWGGRGDRTLPVPLLVNVRKFFIVPMILAILVFCALRMEHNDALAANAVICALYAVVSTTLYLSQKRAGTGSLSGYVMAGYFMNCALSHLLFAVGVGRGYYSFEGHAELIDWVTVAPALWLVIGLARQGNSQKSPQGTGAR